MSNISSQANVNAASQKIGKEYDDQKIYEIDRSYTSFGGNGILTEEQYKEGMELFEKMRHMSAW